MNTRNNKWIKKYYDDDNDNDDDDDYVPKYNQSEEESDEDEDEDEDEESEESSNYDEKEISMLKDIKDVIMKSEPNIIQILNEPLLLEDKANILQLYEIYKTSQPNTVEWLNLRKKVNNSLVNARYKYQQKQLYTKQEHIEMENKLKQLVSPDECKDFSYKIIQLNTSLENKQIIYRKYKELENLPVDDGEYGKLKHWLDWAMTIPHDNIKKFDWGSKTSTNFLKNVSNMLNKELYGMDVVKEQILLFVSSKIYNPKMKNCSLGLIGDVGVGKTRISRLLAHILNFPFQQISFGGVSSTEFIKGHDYTYIGSQPGEIVKCLRNMKYKNGILFFDEFDKISNNRDICSTLLHITDPSQNSEFRDNFLSGITIDLSQIWFIYSMNNYPTDRALRDRIFTINVPGYDLQDKINITITHLIPKALISIGEKSNSISINKSACSYLISKISSPEEKGVRTVEKNIYNMIIKLDFIIKHQDKNGKLSGFNVSFDIGKKIQYPIKLTKEIINYLIRNDNL